MRAKVLASLRKQGFRIKDDRISLRKTGKDSIRKVNELVVSHRIEKARPALQRRETELLKLVASGNEVRPEKIRPRLVQVVSRSVEERFFRYAGLHWSIPVSSGYGRRLRYVVYDEANGKVIGIFGLGDPVFGMGVRDKWIGWDRDARRRRLRNVMDLFVVGAIPPYSSMLCGKLIALLATSDEVQQDFKRKYKGARSQISQEVFDGRLAMLTTSSALGRSSLYNRLRYKKGKVFENVGYTLGSGEFHFSDGVYKDLKNLVTENSVATAKHAAWGVGFRNRREVVCKSLPLLGLPAKFGYHSVRREFFAVPLARNAKRFLRGECNNLYNRHKASANDIFEFFRERWLLPRVGNDSGFREFDATEYKLWESSDV